MRVKLNPELFPAVLGVSTAHVYEVETPAALYRSPRSLGLIVFDFAFCPLSPDAHVWLTELNDYHMEVSTNG